MRGSTMRFIPLLILLGCSVNRTKMTGVISSNEIYFDGWVPVTVTNAPGEPTMWVRLDKKQLEHAKTGADVIFYIEAPGVLKGSLP